MPTTAIGSRCPITEGFPSTGVLPFTTVLPFMRRGGPSEPIILERKKKYSQYVREMCRRVCLEGSNTLYVLGPRPGLCRALEIITLILTLSRFSQGFFPEASSLFSDWI